MAAFVTREVRLPNIGSRIDIPGSFWTGTAPADRHRLFAVVVLEQAQNHRFNARTAGPAVRLQQMADLDSDEISSEAVPDLWMLAKVWHDYEKARKISDCVYVGECGELNDPRNDICLCFTGTRQDQSSKLACFAAP